MARNTLHREIKREAAACGRTKAMDIDPAAHLTKKRRRLYDTYPLCRQPVAVNLNGSLRKHKRFNTAAVANHGPYLRPCEYGRKVPNGR